MPPPLGASLRTKLSRRRGKALRLRLVGLIAPIWEWQQAFVSGVLTTFTRFRSSVWQGPDPGC